MITDEEANELVDIAHECMGKLGDYCESTMCYKCQFRDHYNSITHEWHCSIGDLTGGVGWND